MHQIIEDEQDYSSSDNISRSSNCSKQNITTQKRWDQIHHDHHRSHSHSTLNEILEPIETRLIVSEPHPHVHTNSVNRSYSDLNQTHFLFYAFVLCAIRTMAQQPLNIALARKQTSCSANNISTRQLLMRMYRQEGKWRALMRGMPALTLGCALSEVVYLGLFEFGRERLSLLGASAHKPNSTTKADSRVSRENSYSSNSSTFIEDKSSVALEEEVNNSPSLSRDVVTSYLADAACRVVYIPFSIIAYRQMTWRPFHGKQASNKKNNISTNRSKSVSHASLSSCNRKGNTLIRNQAHKRRRLYSSLISIGNSKPLNMFRTCQSMLREKGLRTLFAGYGTTLLVGCQWTALWWGLYGSCKATLYELASPWLQDKEHKYYYEQQQQEQQKMMFKQNAKEHQWQPISTSAVHLQNLSLVQSRLWSWCTAKDDNMIINGTASILTSAITAILFNPYLVLRTNLQITPQATFYSTLRSLYNSGGIRVFYSGLWLSVGACIVDGALASTSYEYAKLWADVTRTKRLTEENTCSRFASSSTHTNSKSNVSHAPHSSTNVSVDKTELMLMRFSAMHEY